MQVLSSSRLVLMHMCSRVWTLICPMVLSPVVLQIELLNNSNPRTALPLQTASGTICIGHIWNAEGLLFIDSIKTYALSTGHIWNAWGVSHLILRPLLSYLFLIYCLWLNAGSSIWPPSSSLKPLGYNHVSSLNFGGVESHHWHLQK